MYRTHNLGELRIENVNQEVELSGWVQKIRNLGGMIFIDLRDEFGITQLVISDEEKQQLYDKFKMIPLFENTDDAFSYTDKRNELRKQGVKDWEMY